jgi:threonine dehydrogenase-like Zn-dependent dehydrogenase
MNDMWRNEIKLMTSYGAGPADLERALKLISSKRIVLNEMITHRLSFEDAGIGFQLVAELALGSSLLLKPEIRLK